MKCQSLWRKLALVSRDKTNKQISKQNSPNRSHIKEWDWEPNSGRQGVSERVSTENSVPSQSVNQVRGHNRNISEIQRLRKFIFYLCFLRTSSNCNVAANEEVNQRKNFNLGHRSMSKRNSKIIAVYPARRIINLDWSNGGPVRRFLEKRKRYNSFFFFLRVWMFMWQQPVV